MNIIYTQLCIYILDILLWRGERIKNSCRVARDVIPSEEHAVGVNDITDYTFFHLKRTGIRLFLCAHYYIHIHV